MSVLGMLQRRGFNVQEYNPYRGLLFPEGFPASSQEQFYRLLHHYGFRTLLKDLIHHRTLFEISTLTRYCSEETARDYVEELIRLQLVKALSPTTYSLNRSEEVYSLGETLEWYLAQLLRNELECDALWRVVLNNNPAGGDYDVLAECENNLVYIEVKSAPPKSVELENIRAFLNRIQDLKPHCAIFFEDTTLRMKDKIVPHCEKILNEEWLGPASKPISLVRVENETFRHKNLFITNSKPTILDNIRLCLSNFLKGLV